MATLDDTNEVLADVIWVITIITTGRRHLIMTAPAEMVVDEANGCADDWPTGSKNMVRG